MADTNVVNPSTGEKGSVSAEKLERAHAAGARDMTSAETTAVLEEQKHASLPEAHVASTVGIARGFGEAIGLPTDTLVTGAADAFGKGDEARRYLNELQKYHPLASGLGEVSGQVGGAIGLGELTGGGGAAAESVAGRIGQKTAAGALRGGLENLVIGSTHDINETSLGNADAAGEKLLARMPGHFVLGAGMGGVLSAGGAVLGEAGRVIKAEAPGLLNKAADSAVGREFGGDAALGAELRAKVGGIPRSASEVTQALTKEQAAFRAGAERDVLAAKDALASKQTTAAAEQSIKQEAARIKLAKESKAALEELSAQHATAREALSRQHEEAASLAVKLGAERDAARSQLRNLASELDKVKGAELPNAKSILDRAVASFQGEAASLTPPSPQAMGLFQDWVNTFQGRYANTGKLSFKELQGAIRSLDTMETRQRVVSGWGSDPEVKRAFDSIRTAAKEEFDRASEATAASVSEAKGLSAQRLRDSLPSLDKAHEEALANVDNLQRSIVDFDKKSALEMKLAQREAVLEAKAFEKVVKVEDKALDKAQRAEEKAVPKASKETPVDTLLGRIKEKPAKEGMLGAIGAGGALLSLLHGNVAGAAMSALGGFAAHTAKAEGNLLAARTLSALSEHIASADGGIARLAGRAVGRYVRQGAEVATEDRPSRKDVTFDKAAKSVRDIQSNPLILEQQIRTAAGPWAQQAPNVYSALLTAAQRQQAFLASKLPPSRIDPYSLTPHLEPDDLSDSEKWDFVQYYMAAKNPLNAMKEVVDGNGTPQQVEAVAAIYPNIYAQAKVEVGRRIAELQKPLEYERAVNIGTLLQMDTTEVMTGEFQSMLSDMYTARSKSEKGPSASQPRGVNSRLSKSMQSASQQMQLPPGET